MTHFVNTPAFDRLVTAGQVQQIPATGLWYPTFGDHKQATQFGMFVAGAFRRMVPNLRTHVTVHRLPNGFAATCDMAIQGFGVETGLIVCSGGNGKGFGGIVQGIYLSEGTARVLFPVKKPRYIATTESGTRYLKFADGAAFARSKSGPLTCAAELWFAFDARQADEVYRKGGHIMLSDVPSVGMTPLYALRPSTFLSKNCRQFTARGFRCGTQVKRVVVCN